MPELVSCVGPVPSAFIAKICELPDLLEANSILPLAPHAASKVTCESLDGGHKHCPVDTSRGVGLIRQISDSDCVLNRTWAWDRNGIWVTNGCRAEFAVAH